MDTSSHAHRNAQFAILMNEKSNAVDYGSIESQGTFFARLPLRSAAARAGVDDAPGRTLLAGIPRTACQACIFGSLQNAGSGSRGIVAAVSAAGRRRDYRFFGHIDPRRGHG